jgi:hypothetical protein
VTPMSEDPTPDSDPDHLDPAGDVADLLESGEIDVQLSADQDPDELREFIEAVENSDEPTDPGTHATVRVARALLEQTEGE